MRQLEFLEILYKENDWLTLKKLCVYLTCSEKTLRNDIKFINEEFYPFQIETSSKGILLVYPDNYSSDYIYTKVLSLSIEFLLLEHIFLNETYSIEGLAEELFISISTVRRTISKINKIWNRLGVKIITNPCRIVGNEAVIRNFIIHYLEEKYGVTRAPFSITQLKLLEKILLYVTKKNNIKMNFPDLMRIRLWTMVHITRLKNKHLLNIQGEFPNDIDTSILQNSLFCRLFKSIFSLELTKDTIHQLFYTFLNNKFAITYNQLEIMEKRKDNDAWIFVPKLKKFLGKISMEMNIPIQNEEKLIVELYNVLQFSTLAPSIGTDYILNNQRRAFSNLGAREFSYFIKILKKKLHQLDFHKTFNLNSDILNSMLYALVMHWENLYYTLSKSALIKIGLFCDSDIEHTNWIKNILNYRFEHQAEIHIINKISFKAFRVTAQNYDLIITNISGIQSLQTPIICINTIPYLRDFEKIQRKIFLLLKR